MKNVILSPLTFVRLTIKPNEYPEILATFPEVFANLDDWKFVTAVPWNMVLVWKKRNPNKTISVYRLYNWELGEKVEVSVFNLSKAW